MSVCFTRASARFNPPLVLQPDNCGEDISVETITIATVLVLGYTQTMTTLTELHTYWHQQFDILNAQDDTPLHNWQMMAWLSFQLPLALDTSVPFYKDVESYWCDSVRKIMHGRFGAIMKAKIAGFEIDDGFWNIETMALIALNEVGAKVVSPPSHTEKNLDKIEVYKQQKIVLKQFVNSFYYSYTHKIEQSIRDGSDWTRSRVAPFLSNIKRGEDVKRKAQHILEKGKFGAVGVQHKVSDYDALRAMDELLNSIALVEKEGLATHVAGLGGCNICFNTNTNSLGAFAPSFNTIYINTINRKASIFWHEWMHMLEKRVAYTESLKHPPAHLNVYHRISAQLAAINTVVRTIPQDPNISQFYFVDGAQDPFRILNKTVQTLCDTEWFATQIGCALHKEINHNLTHPTYNMECFKSILRNKTSIAQRNAAIAALCNTWRNGYSNEISDTAIACVDYYDEKTKCLLTFHNGIEQKVSNFVSAAQAYDKKKDIYWSKQEELLARAFESFVQDKWEGHTFRAFSIFEPQGRERDYIVKIFETFMQSFKTAWNNHPVQLVAPLNATKISDKRRVATPVKKRLTRF